PVADRLVRSSDGAHDSHNLKPGLFRGRRRARRSIEMAAAGEGYTLTIGDLNQVIPMAFPDTETERQFSTWLRSADDRALKVRLGPASDGDVQGHALAATDRAVGVRIGLDDDDTEGHAISVHFPTTSDADRFRRRLMAAGLITGTIALGSIGAVTL